MRRRLPLLRTLLILTAGLLVCAAAMLGLFRLERVVIARGRVTGGSVQVCSPRDGLVAEVPVRAGQRVRAGDVLVRLDLRELRSDEAARLARIQAVRAELDARRAEEAGYLSAVHPSETEEAARALEQARIALSRADLEWRATAKLGEEGVVGKLQVERSKLDRDLAEIGLEGTRKAVALVEARHRAQIEGLQAEQRRLEGDIDEQQVALEAIGAEIESSTIRSPADGIVTAEKLDDLPGHAARKGDELLRLTLAASIRFEGAVGDAGRTSVRPEQRAKVRLDAYPWLLYGAIPGRVVRVAERRDERGEGFPVEIALDVSGKREPLREGMQGTARIAVGEKVSLARLLLEQLTGRAQP